MKRTAVFVLMLYILMPACRAAQPPSLPQLMNRNFDGRDLKLERVLERNNSYTRHYITYKSGAFKISGILNIPQGKGPFPVIITAHGYINPKVYTTGRGLKREQDYLAKRGYAVLHPDYRNHAGSDKDPDENLSLHLGYTQDVINAVYAVKNSKITALDKERIGLLGHSMGGLIALNIMVTNPELIKAYVLFAPMGSDYRDNFNRWILRAGEEKYGPRPVAEKIMRLYGSPDVNPKFWDNMSAKTFIGNIKSPVQLHHGTADSSVPVDWSRSLAGYFKERGKKIELFIYPGESHEFIHQWPSVMRRTADFFGIHLAR